MPAHNHHVSDPCGVLGDKGCFFKNSEGSIYLPAFDVDAVGATGAVDV